MPGPAFRSGTVVAEHTSANTVLTAPSGIADGDWLVIYLFMFRNTGVAYTSADATPPAGFNPPAGTWPTQFSSSTIRCAGFCWVKKASGESGSYTVTHAAQPAARGFIFAVSGADGTTPLPQTPTQNNGTVQTTTFLSLTTTVANELICVLAEDDNDSVVGSLTAPTGTTPTFTTGVNDAGGSYMAYGTLASAGATGNKTMANNSSGAFGFVSAMLAFQSPTGGGGPTISVPAWFDETLVLNEWFDETLQLTAWFDEDLAPTLQAYVRTASDTVTVGDTAARAVYGRTRTAADLTPVGRLVSSYDIAALADTPVGFWPLNETSGTAAADASGNGHPGTYSGGFTLNQTGIGDGEGAALFDGAAAVVTVPHSSALSPAVISVESWVNFSTTPTSYPWIVSKAPSGGSGWIVFYNLTTGATICFNTDGTATLDGTSPAIGSWVHSVATFDGANVRIYHNGALTAGPTGGRAITANTLSLLIGNDPGSGSGFTGGIAKTALYNYVLSAAQISAHYAAVGTTLTAPDVATGTRPTAVTGTASDTVTIADSATRAALAFTRTASDASTVSDTATRAAYTRTRTSADSVTVSDTLARLPGGFTRSVSDVWTVSDAATRAAYARARSSSDAVATISDAASRAAYARTRSSTDTFSVSDAAAGVKVILRATTDVLSVSDAATRAAQTLARSTADTVSVSDAATRAALARTRTTADAWSVSDSTARAGARLRTGADAWTVVDFVILGGAKVGVDSWTVGDAATRRTSVAKGAADSWSVSDQTARLFGQARFSLDVVTVTDRVTARPIRVSAADSVTVSDVAVGVYHAVGGVLWVLVSESVASIGVLETVAALNVDELDPFISIVEAD